MALDQLRSARACKWDRGRGEMEEGEEVIRARLAYFKFGLEILDRDRFFME